MLAGPLMVAPAAETKASPMVPQTRARSAGVARRNTRGTRVRGYGSVVLIVWVQCNSWPCNY
jgi:hypothetical protein